MKSFLAAIVLLLGGATAALAQTPDGETPAEEAVCDGQTGASKGLCIAYCEAMDCDADPNANATACAKVKGNWQSKNPALYPDPPLDLPCDVPEATCPCGDNPIWADVIAGQLAAVQCGGGPNAPSLGFGADGKIVAFDTGCIIVPGEGQFDIFFPIADPGEAQACKDDVLQSAADQGLDCGA